MISDLSSIIDLSALLCVGMIQSPIFDLAVDFMWNWKKNPNKESALLDQVMRIVHDQPQSIVTKAFEELQREHTFFPNLHDIKTAMQSNTPIVYAQSEDCMFCGAHGLIFGVKGIHCDGTVFDVALGAHDPNPKVQYKAIIVGSCNCGAGKRWARFPVLKPFDYIINRAIDDDTSCDVIADQICTELNFRKVGKTPPEVSGKMQKTLEIMFENLDRRDNEQ